MSDDLRPELREVSGGTLLFVRAQPGARRTEFAGRHDDQVKIRIAAPPTDDRANEALVAFLARSFDLRRSQVSIRSGSTSRRKRVKLDGIDAATASRVLDRLLAD